MKPFNYASRKTQSVSAISFAVVTLFASVGAHAGGLLPVGGQFVAGSGSIDSNGTQMTINQTSSRGIIDWKGFSIGHDNRVDIHNGNGATLNRVTGNYSSWISGMLTSTGSVYLINPQGVVIAPSGVISTGGRLVVSTLDIDNTAFMNGGPLTFTGNSNAQIVNLGTIGSSGGDVFLISRNEVSNSGSISAPTGTVELVAGQSVLLQDSTSSRQVFVQTGSHGNVTNRGTLQAAQVSLQAADGNIYAMGGNHSAIRATGTATRDGHVWLVADTGYVKQVGRVDATNADGTGGTVDTVAGIFSTCLHGHTTVAAGLWNITTPSLVMTWPVSAAFSNSLNAGTSVNVTTTQGDIEVGSDLDWRGNASLSLGAYRSIAIDPGKKISNRGAGNLTLRADLTGFDVQGSVTNRGTLDWSKSTGTASAFYDMNGAYVPGRLLANAAWTPTQGSGLVTQITGYALANWLSDLMQIANNPAGNYAIGKDIDGTNRVFISVGTPAMPFTGQFDGLGHTVSLMIAGLTEPDGTNLPAGMFGVIGSTGVVRNLNLRNSILWNDFHNPSLTQAGMVAGINKGHIANVFASGSLRFSNGAVLGGLVGENDGVIERSASDVNLTASQSTLAGLVGINNGTIAQSYSTGIVSASNPVNAGGLVAVNRGKISQSFTAGAVALDQASNPNPGAIAGDSGGTVTADNYWNVQATGLTNGGGVPDSHGLTTAQMSNPASFVGWDFSTNGAWFMPNGSTHPVLQWQQ